LRESTPACTVPDLRISRACCAAGYRAAGANFSTKMHVRAAPGRSGGPPRSRFDLPDLSDVPACSRPVGHRRKTDRAQEAPERPASAWSASWAAVSVAVLARKDKARAAEELLTLQRGRTATTPYPENPLGRCRPCSPVGVDWPLLTGPRRPGPEPDPRPAPRLRQIRRQPRGARRSPACGAPARPQPAGLPEPQVAGLCWRVVSCRAAIRAGPPERRQPQREPAPYPRQGRSASNKELRRESKAATTARRRRF
jgi:hypothetical protein